MKKILKRTLVGLLVVLVGIQFIPTDTNQQDGIPETDIRYVYDVPEKVLKVLETSCYDCHSNNTNYPWYSKVQPVRLLMDKHIREGKKELNFSEFGGAGTEKDRINKLRIALKEIKECNNNLKIQAKAKLIDMECLNPLLDESAQLTKIIASIIKNRG